MKSPKPTQPSFPMLPNLETEEAARAEDLHRSGLIRGTAASYGPKKKAKAIALAEALRVTGEGGAVHQSPGCSTYMRMRRGYFGTSALEICARQNSGKIKVFTLIPAAPRLTAGDLEQLSGSQVTAALRSQLVRRNALKEPGVLFLALHGEYDPETDTFAIHAHGFGTGGKLEVIERLRSSPCYSITTRTAPPPIRVSRINDPAFQLTYCLQSFWPSRRIGPVGETREIKRSHIRRRIAEPAHTVVLLWLDRHRLSDLTLAIGARFGSTGLVTKDRPVSVHQKGRNNRVSRLKSHL